ncbi:MAG: co-chaperone GroES [Simkaniaceae bacterium]|nr:co-chaperone GroES [Simkaniaceae bacterium]
MSVKNVKPLGKRILVKRVDSSESEGGILLPDSAREKPRRGTVVAVGPGETKKDGSFSSTELSVGDEVFFVPYAGAEVHVDEEGEYLMMSEEDVLAVVG